MGATSFLPEAQGTPVELWILDEHTLTWQLDAAN
jgi:hypothetical protein